MKIILLASALISLALSAKVVPKKDSNHEDKKGKSQGQDNSKNKPQDKNTNKAEGKGKKAGKHNLYVLPYH